MDLKAMRDRKGLTQDEVSALSRGRLSQASVSRLEIGGTINPSSGTVATLARIYGVELGDVYKALAATLRGKSEAA